MLALGRPRDALHHARAATERHESLGASKFAWRSRLAAAEALLELGRVAEAAEELPALSPGNELQDIVYDTATRVGVALALGRTEEAVELARRASADDAVLAFGETAAVAVEAFVAGGLLDEAEAVLRRTERVRVDLGRAGLEISEGTILLAARQRRRGANASRPCACTSSRTRDCSSGRGAPPRSRPKQQRRRAIATPRPSCSQRACTSAHVAGAFRVRDDARVQSRASRPRRSVVRRRAGERDRRARCRPGRRATRDVDVRGRAGIHAADVGERAGRARGSHHDALSLGGDGSRPPVRHRGQVRRRRGDGDLQRGRCARRSCSTRTRGRACAA